MNISIAEAYPLLNAADASNAVWWDDDELYQFADEAAKRLARRTGALAVRDDTTLATVTDQFDYTLPARHVSTVHVSVDGTALLPATVEELEALDETWTAALNDFPQRFVQNRQGVGTLTLYPKPADAADAIALVFHAYPPTVGSGAVTLALPESFGLYFLASVVAGARGREGKGAMPEVAGWMSGIADLIESTARGYYGGAQ